MAAAAEKAGLLPGGQADELLAALLQETTAAFLSTLDEHERLRAETFLTRASTAATVQWQLLQSGAGREAEAPRADASYVGEEDFPATTAEEAEAELEEAAQEHRGGRFTAAHVQKELTKLVDCTQLRSFEATLRRQGNWDQLERLQELRHPGVSHRWLWHLDARSGAVLAEADYVLSVQKRLGARVYEGCSCCRVCGSLLDPQLEHSETCATAAATRGHYACVRALVEGFRLADPGVSTEPRGLTDTAAYRSQAG